MRAALVASALIITAVGGAQASCFPPEKPFLPADAMEVRAYADLIREDFEGYIFEVQEYFRCLDAERARVFTEAQEVSQDYGRFQDLTADGR